MIETLYDDDQITVLFEDSGRSDCLAITFNDAGEIFGDKTRTPDDYWGQKPITKLGFSGLGVISKRENWFPDKTMTKAAPAIRDIAARHKRVFTYGCSMGAYAAIKHGRLLGAEFAMAFSPQWSLDPDLAGYDRRYTKHFRPEINRGSAIGKADAPSRSYVFYDAYHKIDSTHAEEIQKRCDGIRLINVPTLAHGTIRVMRGSGPLERLVDACGQDDRGAILTLLAERRRAHPDRVFHTLQTLSAQNPYRARRLVASDRVPARRRPPLFIEVAFNFIVKKNSDAAYETMQMCKAAGGGGYIFAHRMMNLEELRGNFAEAVSWGRQALEFRADAHLTRATLSGCLLHLGEIEEAVAEIALARLASPNDRGYQQRQDAIGRAAAARLNTAQQIFNRIAAAGTL